MKNASVAHQSVDSDGIAKAVTKLAQRINALETSQVPTAADSSNAENLAPAMQRMLVDLKALRTELITATSDLDERLAELQNVKSENQKLKYRVHHLLRSLDASEK